MSSLSLAQRRAIDHSKELLVPAAERLLDDARVVRLKSNDFGHAQLRNLLAVALETESPAVVFNFIRYLMGRDGSGTSWSSTKGEDRSKKLGQRFLDELESGSVQEALEDVQGLDGEVAHQLARIELIRQFLGFTIRYLRYLDLERRSGGQNNDGEGGS